MCKIHTKQWQEQQGKVLPPQHRCIATSSTATNIDVDGDGEKVVAGNHKKRRNGKQS